jgi:AmpD protein
MQRAKEAAVMPVAVDGSTGLVSGAVQRHSPNQDARPLGQLPELVVLHGISLPPGHFGGADVDAMFSNRLDVRRHAGYAELGALRVSAHLLLRRNGQLLQYVPLTRRAWHAGVSCWQRRPRCNDFAIGIELEGTDTQPYDDAQYAVLVPLLAALFRTWPVLTLQRLVGHSDIAPGRKTDPGPAFDWARLRRELGRVLDADPTTAAPDSPHGDGRT